MDVTVRVDELLTDSDGNDAGSSGRSQSAEPRLHQISMPVSKIARNRETRLIIA